MNQKLKIAFVLGGVLLFAASNSLIAGSCECCSCGATVKSGSALTESEAEHLQFMREEEKLARDVYLAMGELYNQRVFSNIPRAEQHHMNAILGLLNAYGVADPVIEPGKFSNEKLQRLYDELVARGSKSREDAFLVGALVEEVDIADLKVAIKQTTKDDLRSVYENLLGGSERHLNAFVRNYEAVSGKTYQAQKLTQAEVDGILGR